ncbi:hypothetical protein PFICI_10323 [Pestalotiopsis fici W106-1]|uniref:Nephrocystin 3-like N-terminal domain-containing protein n=1 Tax=Pestalotiopsis fici (strain W106-1 / CGMCC3.15140) TaxID=1229662 RepID=W3WZF6_PESFW|nr:uncharacterized protein PFICI_10323 [Pestalotiopsis fici W106-1]ETS78261.1 hypothetical protein PFICI_10323 [Pestalotiopsis fici W106-1]
MDAPGRAEHERENGKVHVNATNISVVSSPIESEPVLDIIFVHGLQGHPFHTWAAKPQAPEPTKKTSRVRRLFRTSASSSATTDHDAQNGFFWPRDALPTYCPHARILTWGYDSNVTGVGNTVNRNSLYEHGQDLIFTLKRNLVSKRPIIFVTHSLGGIIIKDALSFSNGSNDPETKSVVQNTAAIVFLGTPHRGSQWAALGETARRIVAAVGMDTNHKILDSLGLQTSELNRVQTSFSNVWNTYGFRVKTFQEGLGFKPTSVFGMNKKIVDNISSALGDAREESETLQASHTEMCRFSDGNDQNAVKVLDELRIIYNWVLGIWKPQHIPNAPLGDLAHDTPPTQEPHPVSDEQIPLRRDKDYLLAASFDSFKFPGIVPNIAISTYKSSSLATIEKLWSSHLSPENNSEVPRRLLWIKGSLGSGKSTVMREAFLQRSARGHYTAAFFCDASAKEDLLRSASGMFRSLLYQLLPLCFSGDLRHDNLVNILETKFDRAKVARVEIEWELKELEQLLKTIIGQNLDRDIVLFIDALDQYSEEDRIFLIDCLEDLSSKDYQFNSKVQIWVSSRDQVLTVPEDCLSIQIESVNWEDINEYVDEKLKLYPKRNLDEFDKFKMQLKTKSSGNFLWVVLVADIIRRRIHRAQYNIKSLETQLGELPEQFYELYHTMLKEARGDHSIRLKFFQWAVLSEDLSLEHWQHILPLLDQPIPHSFQGCRNSKFWEEHCTNVGDHISHLSLGLFRASLPLDNNALSMNFEYEKSIDGAAGSMDSRSGNSRTVRPVHESVKTFFTQHNGFRALTEAGQPCSLSDGYTTILHTCLDFISLKDFDGLVKFRQLAYSTDQASSSSTNSLYEGYHGSPRSQSIASFSSAGSRSHSWDSAWSDTSSADEAVSLEANPQSQSLILRDNLLPTSNGEGEVTSLDEMINFRLEHLSSLELCDPSDSDVASSNTSIISENPEQSTTAQQVGTVFLTYVTSNFLGFCQALDLRGYTPEIIIDRLQNERFWNRWLCLNETDPSTLKLFQWTEIEQLHTWMAYLSTTTKASTYVIPARNCESLRNPGEWKSERISLRYCLDLGHRFIPHIAEDSGGQLNGSRPDRNHLTVNDPLARVQEQLIFELDKNPLTEKEFMPFQKLRHILTPNVIQEVLGSLRTIPVTSDDVAIIYRSFLRIFSILILVCEAAEIRIFLDKNIDDDCLPLTFETDYDTPHRDKTIISLKTGNRFPLTTGNLHWSRSNENSFLRLQYTFLVPFLARQTDGFYHYKIPSAEVELPIVKALPWRVSLGSQIYKVRFSSYSTDFSTSQNESEEWFLLYRAYARSWSRPAYDWKSFLSKVYTSQYLKRDKRYNSNILEVLCSVEQPIQGSDRPAYTIISPCPEGDLWSLFDCESRDNGYDLEWLGTQFCNMAKALAAVHIVSKLSNPLLPRLKYLRQDHLQHDNFLWFRRHGQSPGYLILSNLTDGSDISPLAPECQKQRWLPRRARKGNLGKAAHVWSLGAIWLDMITWYLKGRGGVLEFRERREKESNGFYHRRAEPIEDKQMMVSPAILSLIQDLKSVKGCPLYISSVLDIIEYGMLVVDRRQRVSAQELVDILDLSTSIYEL